MADDEDDRIMEIPQPLGELVAELRHWEVLAHQAQDLIGGDGADRELLEGERQVRRKLLSNPKAHLATCHKYVHRVGGQLALGFLPDAPLQRPHEGPPGYAVRTFAGRPIGLNGMYSLGDAGDVVSHRFIDARRQRQNHRIVLERHKSVDKCSVLVQAFFDENHRDFALHQGAEDEVAARPRDSRLSGSAPIQQAQLPAEIIQIKPCGRPIVSRRLDFARRVGWREPNILERHRWMHPLSRCPLGTSPCLRHSIAASRLDSSLL
mmetsp:Transcript_140445/g.350123  ORF Transcript_140445/g.350123 Transcript_140445/m.350123 type:complete len:264 (-) Transcript_140445:1307-2098(-)